MRHAATKRNIIAALTGRGELQFRGKGKGRVSIASGWAAEDTWKYGVFLSTFRPKLAPLLDAAQGLIQIPAGRGRR
jgi:hypothetical protein